MKIRSIVINLVILMVAFSTQAFAYFSNNHLIEVVYNGTTAERAVDLGDISTLSLDNHTTDYQLSSAGSINLTALQASSWSDLRIGYFAYNTAGKEYFATTQQTTPTIISGSRTGFTGAYSSVVNTYYNSQLGGSTHQIVDALPTNLNAYVKKMDASGSVKGQYAGFNKDATAGESNLSALGTTGYVDMYLYQWDLVTANAGPDATSPYVGILRLMADGSTVLLHQEAVPIPASFLIFGSSLFGLFGLKRKNVQAEA
jgi:hypothetical protein